MALGLKNEMSHAYENAIIDNFSTDCWDCLAHPPLSLGLVPVISTYMDH
jgi:hypothetical protein